jgi:hypothetical protein
MSHVLASLLQVRKSILDIQASFKKLVEGLRRLNINILDVKATR